MKAFEYAAPRTEREVLSVLSDRRGAAEVLAGGTDLIGLMKKMIVTPDRVVNLKEVDSLRGIEQTSEGVRVGAVTNLDEMLDSQLLAAYPAVKQAIEGISSLQLQAQGTLGGELCQRPQCWYFRSGHGLLADRGRRVEQGDNRYHAILGNDGPAKFVHPSRLAPALIALGASVRIIGPAAGMEQMVPLAEFFRAPRDEHQRENILLSDQIVTHVLIPPAAGRVNATYEVRHGAGPDYPLAAAAVSLNVVLGVIREAKVVLGHVAPTPWVSQDAEQALVGRTFGPDVAEAAGRAAVRNAAPLSDNVYKVQLARVAVKRATLRAVESA